MSKHKVKLNKTMYDTFLFSIILVLAFGLLLGLKTMKATNEELYVFVFVKNRLIDKMPLSIDKTVIYNEEEFLAPITLEVADSKVRVEKEESPLNLCSIKGFTDVVGDAVMCLPNSFYFVIMGRSYREDPVSYVPQVPID